MLSEPEMPRDLLFTVAGSAATLAQPITLAEVGLRERRDLQEWVLAHPAILGDDVLIVTFEFDRWWATGANPTDRLDVLGLATDGRLLVAELKRDKAPDTVEMQAVKYAAMASRFTQETLATQHARFLTQRGSPTSEDAALQHLVAHAGELDAELLRRPRIAIVAGDFPPVLTATAVWLTEMGLDLTLIRVQAYRTNVETMVTVSQLFPVKDVEEFTVTPRQAEVKAVDEKRQRQKDVTTTNRLLVARVLEDGTMLRLRPEGINSDVRASIVAWVQADPKRESARWSSDPGGPLIWDANGQHYTPSGLAALIVQEATGLTRSIRGGDWWVTEEGRDLVEMARDLVSARETLYLDFWTKFVERLRNEHPDWVATRGQPASWSWFDMASPLAGSHYVFAFKRGGRLGCELYIDEGDKDRNIRLMTKVSSRQKVVDTAFGRPLEWNWPDDRHRYASVFASCGEGNITETERHDDFMGSLIDTAGKLQGALDLKHLDGRIEAT
jgi:hypothetical protein